jgi:dihydroorotate dehydrogenase
VSVLAADRTLAPLGRRELDVCGHRPRRRLMALAQVREVRARVGVPIVGMGGVSRGRHAGELICAAANLVAVGTESFRDPLAGARVAAEMAASSANSGRMQTVA